MMKEHKIGQKDLADLLKTTQPTVSYYIRGKRSVDAEILKRLTEIFEVDVANLVTKKEK